MEHLLLVKSISSRNFETNLTAKKRYSENQEYSSIFKKNGY